MSSLSELELRFNVYRENDYCFLMDLHRDQKVGTENQDGRV